MTIKRFLFAVLLWAAGCRPAAESAPARRSSVIRLGQVIDRTGSMATPSWAESIRLAVAHANQALQQARGPVRFEVLDANSGNSPEMARAAALHLVKQQGAKAIITDSSQDDIGVSMLAYDGDPAHDLEVPVICMACTAPEINDPAATDGDPVKQAALRNGKGWNFRTAMSSEYQAGVLVKMLTSAGRKGDVNGDGKFKLSVYASEDPYGRGFSDAIKAEARKARPGAIVEQVFHGVKANPAQYDWSGDVAKVIDKKNETTGKVDGVADAVLEITFPKFSLGFTKAYLASGSKLRLVHTHNFRAARVIETLKEAVEGQEGTSQAVVGEGASGKAFAADLKSATGQFPAFRDAAAYDAAMTLMLAALQAVHRNQLADPAALSGGQIRAELRSINDVKEGERVGSGVEGIARAVQLILSGKPIDYQGASGPCDFDANGNVMAQLARFQVQGGRFADVERFDCVEDPSCPQVHERAEGQ